MPQNFPIKSNIFYIILIVLLILSWTSIVHADSLPNTWLDTDSRVTADLGEWEEGEAIVRLNDSAVLDLLTEERNMDEVFASDGVLEANPVFAGRYFEVKGIVNSRRTSQQLTSQSELSLKEIEYELDNRIFGTAYLSPSYSSYSIEDQITLTNLFHVRYDHNIEVLDYCALILKNPDVESCEPNYIVSLNLIPNDSRFGAMWALRNTGQTGGTPDADIDADQAWDIEDGTANSPIIAVLDTGVDYNHIDLGGCIGSGCKVLTGYDYVNGDSDPMDDNFHGTHVAGTIAALMNNNEGTVGVCPGCRILPVKILNSSGVGNTSIASQGIYYAANRGARVINNSWGFYGNDSSLKTAVDWAKSRGVIVVGAAGNDNRSSNFYPAAYSSAIAVSATDHNDQKASFSNYGSWVDIAAPGASIISTYPNGSYATFSGTSMAAPHVSGVIGLMLSYRPTLTFEHVKGLLALSADPIARSDMGSGRLNAYQALMYIDSPPQNYVVWQDEIDFGIVSGANPYSTRYLDITNLSSSPITISLTCGDTAFIVPAGPIVLEPNTTQSIGVSFDPNLYGDYSTSTEITDGIKLEIVNLFGRYWREGLVAINSVLPDVYNGSVSWGDYDGDGDLDAFISGLGPLARIYKNTDGNFADIGAGLVGVHGGGSAWGDYDNDGDLDLIYHGNPHGPTEPPFVTKLYKNIGNDNFSEIETGIVGADRGALDWGDYDNDGDLDLLFTGTEIWNRYAKIYRNDGNDTFVDIGVSLPAGYDSDAKWADYNNDDYLDFAIMGANYARIYKNNGDGFFSDISAGLEALSEGGLDWGDYDNDGDLDLAMVGNTHTTGFFTKIYTNNGNDTFSELQNDFVGYRYSDVNWGDLDNDGDLDLLVSGYTGSGNSTDAKFYFNNGPQAGGGWNFSTVDFVVNFTSSVHKGSRLEWGDYDNDGDLDLLTPGEIYKNILADSANQAPSPPQNLSSLIEANSITLKWDLSSDDLTPQQSLTYNFRLSTSPGGQNLVSPMSRQNGYRLVPDIGNIGFGDSISMTMLPVGDYYWSVQAVDNSFAGSEFAQEQGFSIRPPLTITKTVGLSNHPIQPGDPLTYTIVVANDGFEDTIGVVISDTLPIYIDGPDLYTITNITMGQQLTFPLNVTLSNSVPFREMITNTAFFSHTSGSGQDDAVFTVVGPPQLAITKTVQLSSNPVQAGDPLTYTIVVANQGAGNASNVVITDILPTYIDGLDLNQTLDITAGESLTFTLNVTLSNSVPFGEVITNTAFFSHASGSGQDSSVFSVKEAQKTYLPVISKD